VELHEPASFVIAVQWHPEAGDDLSLFTALAAAAGHYRDAERPRLPGAAGR
jgi:gamma-glutamyl-gamma-aminobutyrate hydrolase PuuD